ncbi:MAG: hypothetical protein AAGK00_06010 [Pseudomonadota bacterium]
MTETLIYFAIGLAGLLALCTVLVIIGRAAADCPQIGAAAKVGTLVVTTGFASMGVGMIALIGAALPLLLEGPGSGLYLAIGGIAIALGIGFYTAAGILRDILASAPRPAVGPGPVNAPEAVAA